MTIYGWIIMGVSVGSVTLLFGWCVWKVLTTPTETGRVHGFEQETPDKE